MKRFILATLLVSATVIQADEIVLSAKIKKAYKNKINRDMYVFENLNFQEPIPQTLQIMDLSSFNKSSLSKWLNDRIKYIIEEDATSFKKQRFNGALKIVQNDVIYPNATTAPYFQNSANLEKIASQESDSMIVMSNIGAALYYSGKSTNPLYGMKIPNGFLKKSTKVVIDSPRSGVIRIGEGLFHNILTVNSQNPDAFSNSINRLSTFFHEARHSDGNAASLGFFHTKCPAGHSYENESACDENFNGPYAIGALMTLEMLKACDDACSENEKEVLKLVALDSFERIIHTSKKGSPSTHWDATPESL